MERNVSIQLNFGVSKGTPTVRIKLEQEDWAPDTGVLTTPEMLKFVGYSIFGRAFQEFQGMNCAMNDDGSFTSIIYAYPYEESLVGNYKLFASWGSLFGARSETYTFKEIISSSFSDEVTIQYPLFRQDQIIEFEWQGDVYNKEGDVISPPTWYLKNKDTIKFSFKEFYGSFKIRYRTYRDSYALTISKRDDAIENKFSAVIYAVYHDGLVFLEMKEPPGVNESDGYEDYDCGGGSTSIPVPGDGPEPPSGKNADREITKDYCSGEVITDNTYEH